MTYIFLAIIAILLVIIGFQYREIRFYKKQHDYYIEIDEENKRLQSR